MQPSEQFMETKALELNFEVVDCKWRRYGVNALVILSLMSATTMLRLKGSVLHCCQKIIFRS